MPFHRGENQIDRVHRRRAETRRHPVSTASHLRHRPVPAETVPKPNAQTGRWEVTKVWISIPLPGGYRWDIVTEEYFE